MFVYLLTVLEYEKDSYSDEASTHIEVYADPDKATEDGRAWVSAAPSRMGREFYVEGKEVR